MQKQAAKRLRRTIAFPRLAKQETAALFFGSFLIALGGATLASCQTRGARMLFLVGAGLAAFGIAKSVAAMRNAGPRASVLEGAFYAAFGALIVLGGIAGASSAARVFGAMLFVHAAYAVAMIAAEGAYDGKKAKISAVRGVLGAALVLFSKGSGALAAAALIVLGALSIAGIFWPEGAMLRTFPKTNRR